MIRTIKTGLDIWKRHILSQGITGVLWPLNALNKAAICSFKNVPRGLIVEPSQECTGNCRGCPSPENPSFLKPQQLEQWLECSPAKPVTIHFSGKHSDPLASPLLEELSLQALKHCSMLSLSTIGLGFQPGLENLPFDRWLFSIPAATKETWIELRGNNRFGEALKSIGTVMQHSSAMVEVVLTLWKPSSNDSGAFQRLTEKHNWKHTQTVFGRFDPTGHHVGRIENIALENPLCPFTLKDNQVVLKNEPGGCPLAGCLFLDAAGTLRPCPFTGDESPHLETPSEESWKTAAEWTEQKQKRSFPACRWCP